MKEIKSVRVRRTDINSSTLDIKVTISLNSHTFAADDIILVGINNDKPVWIETTYKKKDFYKDFTDDQFIEDFISMNSKSEGGGKKYEIVQDPWKINAPIWRKYGYDPYYLNNGCSIVISWNDGPLPSGGYNFSDDKGKEINTTLNITKTVKIITPDDNNLQIGKDLTFEYISDNKQSNIYNGLVLDSYIINEIISKWKSKIPNYDLALCSPANESCSIITYKDPLMPDREIIPKVKVATNDAPKIKMKIVAPNEVIKTKNDISLKVYIGDVKEVVQGNNTETDDYTYDPNNLGLDEYNEGEFNGQDENKWAPLPGIADDTFDPDTDKGGDNTIEPESLVPATKTQKDFIKVAVRATLSRGEKHGKCARFTFNHVNNYVRLLQGKQVEQGDVHNAGGNANDSGYHKNLEHMGYKKIDKGSISKSSIISQISSATWEVGDVIAYWCVDGPSNSSHVRYGHTQIFTNGYHNNSSYRWSTDNMNNYNSAFVYRSRPGETYRFIIFKAPKTKRINDIA